MFGYSMCLTDDKPLTKIKNFTTTVLVMMNTCLQTERTIQRLLINIVEIKYFERFTQIVGLFGSLK